MPELPEVETVRRGLHPSLAGASIRHVRLNRADLRFPFPERFVEQLSGNTVTALRRRAKYLLIDLASGDTVISHLGMSGSFRVSATSGDEQPGAFHYPKGTSAAHDHVILDAVSGTGEEVQVVYNDPRRFGFMLMTPTQMLEAHPLIRDLGIEPMSNAMNADALAKGFSGRTTSLKAALLDQRIIAGLGNIYVCEALFRAGLSPTRPAGSLVTTNGAPRAGAERLANAIRAVLDEALVAGGSSLRDHRQVDGTLGYFQHRFGVYGREGLPCPTSPTRTGGPCTKTIARTVQNGRSTFYCPDCQR